MAFKIELARAAHAEVHDRREVCFAVEEHKALFGTVPNGPDKLKKTRPPIILTPETERLLFAPSGKLLTRRKG